MGCCSVNTTLALRACGLGSSFLPRQFSWQRTRLFDRDACTALFERCRAAGEANVTQV
jgi:hypothetical protein